MLLAWEYGGARGHVSRLRLVAESLGAGHSYDAALSRLDHAHELEPLCRQVFRGPRLKVLGPKSRPSIPRTASFFDTLVSCGFMDSGGISRNIGWWREALQLRQTDLLVADSAPRAMLAARSLGIPCVAIGNGYFVPPASLPGFPPLLGQGVDDGPYIGEMIAAINAAIDPYGLSPISRLPELFQADDQIVCTLPQLDPYGEFRETELLPPLQYEPADGLPPGEEVFIYLSSQERNDPAIVTALKSLKLPAVLVCPGLSAEKVADFRAAGLSVETQALTPAEIRRRSRLMVHSGNHGTLCLGIAMGLPQVALPQHAEQRYNAVRGSELGVLKRLNKSSQKAEAIEGLIREALEDSELARRAREVAESVGPFVTQDVKGLIRERTSRFLSGARAGGSKAALSDDPASAPAGDDMLPMPPPIASRSELQQQFFELLMESQYWSPRQLQDYQRGELEQLLRHARANVPFYENRLDAVFRSDGSIDWDRWHETPMLRREDLLDNHEAMQARTLPPGFTNVGTTVSSGTTGIPTQTSHTSLSVLASNAALLRSYRWHELDHRKVWVSWEGEDTRRAVWPEGLNVGPWMPPWLAEGGTDVWQVNFATMPEQVIEFIERHGARYVSGGTVRLQLLALEAERLGRQLNLDAVLTRGAAVGPDAHHRYREAFGARAIPLYSSKEGHKMAHSCPASNVYHVNAELLLLEVLRNDGTPCAPGERGRVVVTPFYNAAQPLIRYEIGDLATPGEACACGRTLPVLQSIDGRSIHIYRLPDGSHAVPTMPITEVQKLNAALWQMAQIGPKEIEVRYVPLSNGARSDEAAIADAIRRTLHPDFDVSFRQLERFELPPSGKLVQYAQEWRPL